MCRILARACLVSLFHVVPRLAALQCTRRGSADAETVSPAPGGPAAGPAPLICSSELNEGISVQSV